MKTPFNLRSLFLFLITVVILLPLSCENIGDPGEGAPLLVGEWSVEENSPNFKSTNVNYQVYISLYEQDSTQIIISNFYQLGLETTIRGEVTENRIELLPNQQMSSFGVTYTLVSGSGVITDDYQNIQWEYKVDDGSGELDEVTAVYTRI